MELYGASNAFDAFQFMLSRADMFLHGDIDDDQSESVACRKQQLINLLQNYDRTKDLTNLSVDFFIFFDIYLYFIGFKKNRFDLINDYSFPDRNKQRKIAFVVLNGDYTVCGPLFAHVPTGKHTVFTFGDMSIATHVDKYIERLNRTGKFFFLCMKTNPIDFLVDPRLIPITKEQSPSTMNSHVLNDHEQLTDVHLDMLVDDHSALINGVNSGEYFREHTR